MKQLETFDEFEGIHQKCSHYIILTAARGIAYKISYRKETFYLIIMDCSYRLLRVTAAGKRNRKRLSTF